MKMAAIRGKSLASDSAECVQCLDCVEACPKRAITVGLGAPEVRYSPSRRRFLRGVGLGVVGVAVARVDASAVGQDQYAVRPPAQRTISPRAASAAASA